MVSTSATIEAPAVDRRRKRKAPWVIAVVVVLVTAGIAVAVARPFSSGAARSPGVAESADSTGLYTVARQDLSSQTQVSATLGYAGSFSIGAPSGASAQDVAEAQQSVTEDQQTLSADEQTESVGSSADNQAISAAQNNVSTDQATLTSDQAQRIPRLCWDRSGQCGVQSGRSRKSARTRRS